MALKHKTITKQSGRQLHDRATRGESLTEAEQAAQNAWYAQQDEAESTLLAPSPVSSVSQLQAQIDAALARLQVEMQRIQTLTEENEALRRENASLVSDLTQIPTRAG